MPAQFIAGSFVATSNLTIPRPSAASNGHLAVVSTTQTGVAAGWTRVAATGGGSVYWRLYDGSASDTFPTLENPGLVQDIPRVLSVWSEVLGVEDVAFNTVQHGYAPSPGGTPVTLPARTSSRRSGVYVWHSSDNGASVLGTAGFGQNPTAPLTARFQGLSYNQFQTEGQLYAYVASAQLDAIGTTQTYSQRFVTSVTNGNAGTPGKDYTFVLIPSNLPPNAPTLLVPASNETVSKDETNRFSHQTNDPNAGDTQSKSELRYRVVGATAWAATVVNATPNPFVDIAAGTFVAGSYEWQVRTYDAEGLAGPWSSSGFFTAGTRPAGPAITSLVNGQTVNDTPVQVTWTATAGATHFQVRRVADAAGVANTANVLFTSAELLASAGQAYALALPTNSQYEHVQVREKVAGLWSDWAASSKRILVSYTPPAAPQVSVAPVQTATSDYTFTDAIVVTMANPLPTGGQPAVTYLNLFCQATVDGDPYRPKLVPVRIGTLLPAGTFTDYAVTSGVDYLYAAEAVASNGTASLSSYVGEVSVIVVGDEGDFEDDEFSTADFS